MPVDVVAVEPQRLGHRHPCVLEGGEVHDAVDAVEVFGPQVVDRRLDEAGAVGDERPVAGGEIVDDDHVAAGLEEPTGDVGTDVTGPAGDGPGGHGSTKRAAERHRVHRRPRAQAAPRR